MYKIMNIEDEPATVEGVKRLMSDINNRIKSIDAKITQSQLEQERRLREQSAMKLSEHEKETDLYELMTNEKVERLVVERNHWKHEIKKLSVDLDRLEHYVNKK
jgi:hypothetical protein